MNSITFSDQRIQAGMLAVLERRPKVVTEIGGCSEVGYALSLTHSQSDLILFSLILFLSLFQIRVVVVVLGGERLWMTQVIGNLGHRVMLLHPPAKLLFNWALFMKLDVAQNQTCKPAAGFPSITAEINRGNQEGGNQCGGNQLGWKKKKNLPPYSHIYLLVFVRNRIRFTCFAIEFWDLFFRLHFVFAFSFRRFAKYSIYRRSPPRDQISIFWYR